VRTRARRMTALACASFAAATIACAATPAPAAALDPLKPICTVTGLVSGLIGKACSAIDHAKRILKAGKKLLSGHVGGAVKVILGGGSAAGAAGGAALGLASLGAWTLASATGALRETAKVIAASTAPHLAAPWFSLVYWRVAGLAVLLTLPFLFAAAIQGVLRGDGTLILRAAFGYLPLAMLGVGVAAQLTALLLGLTDELCAVVSSASGGTGAGLLGRAGHSILAVSVMARWPFLGFVVGAFTVVGALLLWVEMLIRQAAVYIVVAMLPLAFAAVVWPARRVWALRALELLVALILSKLAIVAVLTLGGAALEHGAGPLGWLTGLVLVVLGLFAPWAMLRLVPFAELAEGAAGHLRGHARGHLGGVWQTAGGADALAHAGVAGARDWVAATAAQMRRDAGTSAESEAADVPVRQLPAGELARAAEDGQPYEGAGGALGAGLGGLTFAGGDPGAAGVPGGSGPGDPADGSGPHDPPDGEGASAGSGATPGAARERSPGMGRIWQAADYSWPTIELDGKQGWPDELVPPLAEASGSGAFATPDGPEPPPPGTEPPPPGIEPPPPGPDAPPPTEPPAPEDGGTAV